MRIPPVFAVAFAFFRLILCSFRFFHCFLFLRLEKIIALSLDTFPPEHSRTFPQDR